MVNAESRESPRGTHFGCRDEAGRAAQVESIVDPVRAAQYTGLPAEKVERALVVSAAEGPVELVLPALYRAIQQGRLHGKTTIALRAGQAEGELARLLRLERLADGELLAQTLDVAAYQCFERAATAAQQQMAANFAQEIVDTVERWAPRFFAGAWAQAVLGGKLTRAQFVQTLSNMHQYVRFTTRLLGRAVAISPTTQLRNHFLDHLSGEVNHELIIERDLKYLGADVDYVVRQRVANSATRAFMVAQQSMVSFECHPVLFMACPLAAEGITAHLDQPFLAALRACVASWGYGDPKQATLFFSSHINTDGGDDGHWQKTIDILGAHLQHDIQQQEFLSILHLAMDSIERSFNSNVVELGLLGGD